MGNFANNAITEAGRALLADVQSGAVFTPTRIVMGSGSMPTGTTTRNMTNVIAPVKSLAITKKVRTPDGKCIFGGVYTNEEITVAFYFRELALYAKAVYLNEDGSVQSEGAETLYSYGNAGDTADYMPAYSTSTVVERNMDLVTWVGNDAQVDLTIESGIYVPRKDFETHASRHALDGEDPITPASIGAATAGLIYEVRHLVSGSDEDLMAVITEIFSKMKDDSLRHISIGFGANHPVLGGSAYMIRIYRRTNLYGLIEAVTYTGNVLNRKLMEVWGEWEWVNPPFSPTVEYRTTDRRNGKTVYKRLDADGVLRYRLDGESVWNTYAQEIGGAPLGLVHKVYDTNTNDAMDAVIEAELKDMPGHSIRNICVSDSAGATLFKGGLTHITINKTTDEYANIEAIKYHTFGVFKWRRCKYINWQGWEWENPPLDRGVEYRTTERYLGSVVYKKVNTNGDILWRTEGETSWRLQSSASYVSAASVE